MNEKYHSNRKQQLQCSLDILTDGSELTGHGSVFLTISKKSSSNASHDEFPRPENPILARYALSGLSTLTSRLAADQSFKLSSIRAVFCPLREVATMIGIPSLLLALSNYSMTGKLNIVGPMGVEAYTHTMVDLILGKRRVYPNVMTCDIPSRTKNEYYSSWWKVYEDEYIIVHARINMEEGTNNPSEMDDCHTKRSNDSNTSSHTRSDNEPEKRPCEAGAVYIITVGIGSSQPFSFVVLPPRVNTCNTNQILHPLPDVVISSSSSSKATPQENLFRFILHLDPSVDTIVYRGNDTNKNISLKIHPSMAKLTKHHFGTIPDPVKLDQGILIRANHQAVLLNSKLPYAFPQRLDGSSSNRENNIGENINQNQVDSKATEEKICCVPLTQLNSCSTVVLNEIPNHDNCSNGYNNKVSFEIICRRKQILDKINSKMNHEGYEKNSRLQELENLYSQWKVGIDTDNETKMHKNVDLDENEILLSEDSDDDITKTGDDYVQQANKRLKSNESHDDDHPSTITNKASLLVLGTGCAS